MRILKLTWSDFKTFQGEHSLDFRQYGPGLYYVRGVNELEPELGANGAGKSTIWDILHWCLFGTSIRGMASTQIVPWSGSGKPKATLFCVIDGVKTWIKRTYRPNTLTVRQKGETRGVTQEQLEDLLRLNSSMFQNSIIIGQHSQMFFDLKPNPKLAIFTDLLGLDFWLDRAKHASHTASELEGERDELEKTISATSATISEIKRTLGLDKKEALSEDKKNKRWRRQISLELMRIHSKKRSVTEALHLAKAHFKTVLEQTREFNAEISRIQERMDDYNATILGFSNTIFELRTKVSVIEKQRKLLTKMGSKCPTCGSVIDKAHRDKEDNLLLGNLSLLKREIGEVQHDASVVRRKLQSADKKKQRLRDQTQEVEQPSIVEREIYDAEQDIQRFNIEMQACRDELSDLRRSVNKYAKRVAKNERRQKSLSSTLSKKRKEAKELEGMIKEVRFWVRGFKDIRLLEIDEALTALELEVNNYLADLGMTRWTVKLDVERETKSGGMSRGFHVMVDPGTHKKGDIKPWEVWSGGEGQRLRLAGTKALANLIMRQNNRMCNIQVWDEKLVWLSGTGEQDMLELLHETAKREGKQIWLVDQHNLDYPFDDVLTVVKHKGGSFIREGAE